jgi:hypothetical protein
MSFFLGRHIESFFDDDICDSFYFFTKTLTTLMKLFYLFSYFVVHALYLSLHYF